MRSSCRLRDPAAPSPSGRPPAPSSAASDACTSASVRDEPRPAPSEGGAKADATLCAALLTDVRPGSDGLASRGCRRGPGDPRPDVRLPGGGARRPVRRRARRERRRARLPRAGARAGRGGPARRGGARNAAARWASVRGRPGHASRPGTARGPLLRRAGERPDTRGRHGHQRQDEHDLSRRVDPLARRHPRRPDRHRRDPLCGRTPRRGEHDTREPGPAAPAAVDADPGRGVRGDGGLVARARARAGFRNTSPRAVPP